MPANDPTAKTPSNRQPRKKAQKRRRRVLEWYHQSCEERGNAIYETAPELYLTDSERIAEQVARMIDGFPGNDRADFTAWIVTQTKRLASVTVTVKGLLPSVIKDLQSNPGAAPHCDFSHVTQRVLKRLPEFAGNASDTAALREWTAAMVTREATNLALWLDWVVQYERAVYKGLWRVLSGCADLGLGNSDTNGRNDVLAELVSEFQFWLLENVELFRAPGAPLQCRFEERAYWFARGWMTKRLRERARANWTRKVCRDFIRSIHGDAKPKPRAMILGDDAIDDEFNGRTPPRLKADSSMSGESSSEEKSELIAA
jgi:hypothetical protein